MALTNNPQNSNSLFSAANKQYNINQQSSEDLHDVLKSLNIVDPDLLSKEELSTSHYKLGAEYFVITATA